MSNKQIKQNKKEEEVSSALCVLCEAVICTKSTYIVKKYPEM